MFIRFEGDGHPDGRTDSPPPSPMLCTSAQSALVHSIGEGGGQKCWPWKNVAGCRCRRSECCQYCHSWCWQSFSAKKISVLTIMLCLRHSIARLTGGTMFSAAVRCHVRVTELVTTICRKWVNGFHCKLAQDLVIHEAWTDQRCGSGSQRPRSHETEVISIWKSGRHHSRFFGSNKVF